MVIQTTTVAEINQNSRRNCDAILHCLPAYIAINRYLALVTVRGQL